MTHVSASRRTLAAGIVLTLAAAALLLAPVWYASPTLGGSLAPSSAGPTVAVSNNTTCGCSPGALYITNTAPTIGVNVGDKVNATLEWQVPFYKSSENGTPLHIPSIVTNFTAIKAPNVIVLFPQRNVTVSGPGWSNASLATESKTINSHFFFSSKKAYLSTQRIAIMANVTYGTFKLEFRWQWSIYKTNGSLTVGNWSNLTEGYHHQDEITPAPLIYLLNSTVRTLPVGSIFVAHLYGLVANQGDWLLEMEHPNGSVTTELKEWGPNGTTNYWNATVPMQTMGQPLVPGQYLVHLHTPHGAIIFSITVHLTAVTNATVSVVIDPSGCGPVYINGTAYANGATPTFPVGAVTLSVAHCSIAFFHGWSQQGGGISFAQSRVGTTNATLRYNSTMIATYG
jgi:hypothetical protein